MTVWSRHGGVGHGDHSEAFIQCGWGPPKILSADTIHVSLFFSSFSPMWIKNNFSCCFICLVYELVLPCHLWTPLFQDSLLVHLGPKITQQIERSKYVCPEPFPRGWWISFEQKQGWNILLVALELQRHQVVLDHPLLPVGHRSPVMSQLALHFAVWFFFFFIMFSMRLPCGLVFLAHLIHL